MTAPDPLRTFTAALPYNARRAFTLDHRTIPAVHACHRRGDNLTDLATRVSSGLKYRTRNEARRLLTYRLLRAAGLLDDQEGN